MEKFVAKGSISIDSTRSIKELTSCTKTRKSFLPPNDLLFTSQKKFGNTEVVAQGRLWLLGSSTRLLPPTPQEWQQSRRGPRLTERCQAPDELKVTVLSRSCRRVRAGRQGGSQRAGDGEGSPGSGHRHQLANRKQ